MGITAGKPAPSSRGTPYLQLTHDSVKQRRKDQMTANYSCTLIQPTITLPPSNGWL